MTVRDLKELLNNSWINDNARVYLECEVAENVYLKKEVVAGKEEDDDYGRLFVICG